MKKRGNKSRFLFLVLVTIVLLATTSYLVNAGCCLNEGDTFCQEVSETECCDGSCPIGYYDANSCDDTVCSDFGCCPSQDCSETQYSLCPIGFYPWTDCNYPSVEECQKGCCVQVVDNNLENCDDNSGQGRYRKDCLEDIDSDDVLFYSGQTGNNCSDICLQNTPPTGTITGNVYYYAGSTQTTAIDTFVLLGGRIQPGYYTHVNSSGYVFENIPVGDYLITAYYYGYKPINYTITVLQDADVLQEFYFTETTSKGYVTGEVTDKITGELLENAYVSYSFGGAFTNKYGIYSISNVESGSVTFTASKTGYESETKDPITIDPGRLNVLQDFELTPTGYTFNETETCENQEYYCFAYDYQCLGTRITDLDHTCEKYTNESGCCSEIEQIPDCINGQDTDQKITETDFTGKTQYYCKCGNDYYDTLTIDGYCCNNLFRIIPCSQERGTLKGRVKNTDDVYLNGALVEVIKDEITISSDTTSTEFVIPEPIEGFYEINYIPEGTYNITASMYGYYPSTIEVTITSNTITNAPDIILEPMPVECLDTLPAANLKLSNVKGTSNIMIEWAQYCIDEFDIVQFNLYRKNEQDVFVLIKTFGINDDFEFTDEGADIDGLEWDTEYEYKLITITADNEQEQTTESINTGNALCEDKFGDEEFCLDSNLQLEIPMILRVACDYSNNVYVIENCGEEDSDRICRQLDQQTWCTSPDACKNLGIEYNLQFTPNILGMYYYYIYDYDGSEISCEYEITNNNRPRYCYYDFYYTYGPYTTVDRCLDCRQDGSCYDYQSQEACEKDNCGFGNCNWFDSYHYISLGKGFCYQEGYEETDKCGLCSKNNNIFENAFCTPDLCAKLGMCFSTGGSCEDCTDSSRCELYSDQTSCTGTQSTGFNIPDNCMSSEEFTYSDDVCDLKVCKWLNNKCFKDANDDNIPDCNDDDLICQINTQPHSTVITLKPTNINSIGDEIQFSTSASLTYYCIDSEFCCPDKLALNSGVFLPNDDFPLENKEGTYTLYFFSVDKYNNTEPIKNEPIYVDTIIPVVNVAFEIENRTEDDLSDLTTTITVDEESHCTDELTLGYGTLIGSKIDQKITESDTTVTTYSELTDGFYYYIVSCEDSYGNVGKSASWVVIDRFERITVVSPTEGQVVKSPVTIDVRTVNKNYCRYKNPDDSIWRPLNSGFNPDEGNHQYTTQLILESGDYDVMVECYSAPNYNVLDLIDVTNLVFTVDAQPPTTLLMYEKVTGGFYYIATEDSYKSPTIKFECTDNPSDHSFGCKDTRYCYSTSNCTPYNVLYENQTFVMNNSVDTYLCYFSTDIGGNIEETQCVLLVIDNTSPTIAITIEGGEPSNQSETGVSYIAYKRRPIIRVVTNEPSTLLNAYLINGSEHNTKTQVIESTNTLFRLKPEINLAQGVYTFYVELKDAVGGQGNQKSASLTFWVEPSDLEIIFIEPKNGVSSEYSFDLKLKIENTGKCKYALDSADWSFENMRPLEKEDDIYTSEDFNAIADTDTHILYVTCNNSGIFEKGTEELRVDTSSPTFVKTSAVPNPIAEEPVETTLIVETNKKTICKYSSSTSDYDLMENKFSGFDSSDYNLTHYQDIEFSSTETKDYTYYIACEALNGLTTSTKELPVTVDLTIPLQITSKTPEYLSTTSVDLEVYTNKRSQCFYGTTSTTVNKMFSTDKGTSIRNHIQALFLNPGKHTYYIECIKADENAKATVIFTIDTTPPKMEYVREVDYNGTGKTYKTSSLKGEWKATDNESNVKQYDVSLYLDNDFTEDELIDNMITSDEEETFSGIDLNDSETYYFKVSAVNYANLWSYNKTGEGITVDTSLSPLTCKNGKKDSNEADIDCGGVCSEGCPEDSDCNYNTDCISGFCHDAKCTNSTCDDNIKGPKETDVDCGGICDERCSNGQDCGEDDDCTSGNCDVSTGQCVAAGPCYNNKLDPDEADVDCGGVCLEKCNNGDTCESDYDCKSGSCVDHRCFEPGCSDGIKNQDETDTDCGGSCGGCGIGDTCYEDSDCLSDNCINNICEEIIPDRDNDGLNNEWEDRYNEGDLDPDMYDTDGNGISDADEDFDNDGLTNIYEAEYGTDPHKKDTDGDGYSDGEEVDKGTNPLDPDDYPKSKWLFWLFILIALALLGVGGYFGYKKYQEMQEDKIKIPPIGKEEPGKEIKPSTTQTLQAKTQAIIKKVTPAWLRGKIDKTRQKKLKKRDKLFDKFDSGDKKATPVIKEEPSATKEYTEETPRVGWVELDMPRKTAPKLKEKEKISPIFEKLPKITASKFRGKLPSEDVFKALTKMVGAEVKDTTVQEFKDVAQKKKLSKEQLIELINKLSKAKKLDEENLHRILSSIIEGETIPKKPVKQKLPSIVEKEVKKKITKKPKLKTKTRPKPKK